MARVAKHTFWNDRRVECGRKLKSIARELGLSYTSVAKWFSGEKVPTEDYIHRLCVMLDVPYEQGRSEFYKACYEWRSERGELSYYDNFWNQLKLDRKVTLNELAAELHMHPRTLGKIFSGEDMPSSHIAQLICKAFNVKFSLGWDEFKKAHKVWLDYHPDSPQHDDDSLGSLLPTVDKLAADEQAVEVEPIAEAPKFKAPPGLSPAKLKVLKVLYGKISYEEYAEIHRDMVNNNGVALSRLYGKLSFEDFTTFTTEIAEECGYFK